MVLREHKRAASLHEKLQLLRSITHSHAKDDTSIIVDASKYIEELKDKVELLNQDIVGGSQNSINQETIPSVTIDHNLLICRMRPTDSEAHNNILIVGIGCLDVTVETLEKGFLINVYAEKSCPRLLVSILEAFEELNLNVVEATASCNQKFQLEAISVQGDVNRVGGNVDAQVVRQAVLHAIRNRHPTNEQD